jgi:hypothetical protein
VVGLGIGMVEQVDQDQFGLVEWDFGRFEVGRADFTVGFGRRDCRFAELTGASSAPGRALTEVDRRAGPDRRAWASLS